MTTTGVVLMTYGSPRDLDDVGAYITRVRGGREPRGPAPRDRPAARGSSGAGAPVTP